MESGDGMDETSTMNDNEALSLFVETLHGRNTNDILKLFAVAISAVKITVEIKRDADTFTTIPRATTKTSCILLQVRNELEAYGIAMRSAIAAWPVSEGWGGTPHMLSK